MYYNANCLQQRHNLFLYDFPLILGFKYQGCLGLYPGEIAYITGIIDYLLQHWVKREREKPIYIYFSLHSRFRVAKSSVQHLRITPQNKRILNKLPIIKEKYRNYHRHFIILLHFKLFFIIILVDPANFVPSYSFSWFCF